MMADSQQLTPLSIKEGLARRKNSIAIGLVLTFLVLLFYAVTLVQLQSNMAKRKQMNSSKGAQVEKSVAPSTGKTSNQNSGSSTNQNTGSSTKQAE